MSKDAKCRVCGYKTAIEFNIDLKPVAICEPCASQIAVQQVAWWSRLNREAEE